MSEIKPSTPFVSQNESETLKLLELPASLAAEIASGRCKDLQFKSLSNNANVSNDVQQTVLCTQDRTYHVRQVQSSNSIFILRPCIVQISDESLTSVTGLAAIAQCTNTLELVDSSPSASAIMDDVLPVYAAAEEEKSKSADGSTLQSPNRQEIEDNIPCSRDQINLAWESHCAFEYKGSAWQPSNSMLFELWKSVMAAVDLRALDLESKFSLIALADTVEEDGIPKPLLEAVMTRLSQAKPLCNENVAIDSEVCIRWVGKVLLKHKAEMNRLNEAATFVEEWQELLPEKWRTRAHMAMLEDVNVEVTKDPSGVPRTSDRSATIENDRRGARRWHEKFKRP